MHSALYHGWLDHRRLSPKPHAFRARLCMAYLDLAELDDVFRGRWLWSTRRPAPVRFDRRDYLGPADVPLDTAVRDKVAGVLGTRPRGPVRLLTHLRHFGYVFNPVSFYYCFDADDRHVEAIVADVTNTPWRERHAYVLRNRAVAPGPWLRAESVKAMHVSPFHPMGLAYDWKLGTPGAELVAHMTLRPSTTTSDAQPIFGATLALERRPITTASLAWALARYPAMTAQVIANIHWQALRLWLKGVPVHDHPPPPAHAARATVAVRTTGDHAMTHDATTLAHRATLREKAAARRDGALERGLASLAARALHARLGALAHGVVTLIDSDHPVVYGHATERCPLRATVRVRDHRFYTDVAFGGSVGAGESYMAGDWTCDDLPALIRILAVNRGVLDGLDEGGLTRVGEWLRRGLHALARNTRDGSRRNIAAHYDIGNDFFECFLDPSMMYSCAYYETPTMSLADAQYAKLDRLCRKLALGPQDHLLEIGTGWGALALHAARHYGCRVTTTTISREQHAMAREHIDRGGLADRITLRLDDYRDLDGRYDKIVSVEMIEAVGHQYFDTFFATCARLLAPGGAMALQAITIADRQYEGARDSVDFIKRHIFPGCCIPSLGALTASITQATDLRVVDVEDIGPHYATTLSAWRTNLHANAERIRALGYPDALLRMFDFYLAYCEGGYAERALSNVQMVLQDAAAGNAPPARVA